MAQTSAPDQRAPEFVAELFIYASLLAPLIVTVSTSVFPFVFPKVIYLEAIIGLLVATMIALVVWKKEYRFWKTPYFYLLAVYALTLGLSALYAFDPNRAFWSNHERMTGVVFLWFAMALSGMVALFYRVNADKVIRLLCSATVFSVVISLTGIYQRINPSFLLGTGDRAAGVFGNPIYLGGFAAEFFLISAYLIFRFWKQTAKWWFVGAAIINLLALYFSGTRGSTVALVSAGVVIGIIKLIQLYKSGERVRALKIVGAAVGVLILFVLVWPTLVRYVPATSQLSRLTSLSGGTTGSTRLIAWNIAIQGFKERPVLGWGPENYYYVFNSHFNPKSMLFGAYETWFDHAHNAIFDVLVTTGSIGIILYLLQYAIVWWMCFKTTHRDSADELLTIVLSAFFVLHFVHNIFVFDHPGSYALFYLMAGIVAARFLASRYVPTAQLYVKQEFTFGIIIAQIAVILITGLVIIPSARQNSMDYSAQMSVGNGLDVAQKMFEEAIAIGGPHTPDLLLDVGRVAQKIPPQYVPDNAKYFEFAVRSLDTLLQKYEPANVLAALMEGQLLTTATELGDAKAGAKADMIFQKAVQMSPKRQQIYFAWARLKFDIGQKDAGIKLLEQAISFEPDVADGHWYLAVFIFELDAKRALAEMQIAAKLGTDIMAPTNRYVTAQIYQRNSMWADAANVYATSLADKSAASWDSTMVAKVDEVAKKANRSDIQAALRAEFPALFQKK